MKIHSIEGVFGKCKFYFHNCFENSNFWFRFMIICAWMHFVQLNPHKHQEGVEVRWKGLRLPQRCIWEMVSA